MSDLENEISAEELTSDEAQEWSAIWNRGKGTAPATDAAAELAAEAGNEDAEESPETPESDASDEGAEAAEPDTEAADDSADDDKSEAPKSDREKQIEALKKQAEELGFSFDGAAVSLEERKSFRETKRQNREWKRKAEQEIAALKADAQKEADALRSSAKEDIDRAQEVIKALTTYDYDGMAKAVGFEDWNALQEDAFSRQSDPNYKRLKQLERQAKEREERESKEREERESNEKRLKEEAEKRARAEAEARGITEYKQKLSEACKASDDPLLKAFHDDEALLNSIVTIQRANYDEDTRQTVTVQQALSMPVVNGRSIRTIMRANYERLKRAFGDAKPDDDGAATGASNGAQQPAKKAPKSTALSGKPTTAAKPKPKDHRSWIREGARLLEQAARDEEAAQRKLRQSG